MARGTGWAKYARRDNSLKTIESTDLVLDLTPLIESLAVINGVRHSDEYLCW